MLAVKAQHAGGKGSIKHFALPVETEETVARQDASGRQLYHLDEKKIVSLLSLIRLQIYIVRQNGQQRIYRSV